VGLSSASYFVNKWAHIAITFKEKLWTVYVNGQVKITHTASEQSLYDDLAIDEIQIVNPEPKTILQVKEVAMFGHNRDASEIWKDSGSFIGLNGNYN
jgi:hypothetical protein